MEYENNPKSIKYYMKRYISRNSNKLNGLDIADFPAGNGHTTNLLKQAGANPIALDLFPEYFNIEGLECQRADINNGIPLKDGSVDAIFSQEGIEHFENQLGALKEFNRIVKQNGALVITTPNYSNLVSRVSFALSESETFNRALAPNEVDDIWMVDNNDSEGIYHGHLFLISFLKLRTLARLAGFKIKHIEPTKKKRTAVLFFPFLYPFIYLSSLIGYKKSIKKRLKSKGVITESEKFAYKEIFDLSVSPNTLLTSHIFIEFEKICEVDQVRESLSSQHEYFGTT
jgi:SAM-dependent methyltransferase